MYFFDPTALTCIYRKKRQTSDVENPNTEITTRRRLSDDYELALLDGLCIDTLKRSRNGDSQRKNLPSEWPVPNPVHKKNDSIPEDALRSVLRVGTMIMTPLSGPARVSRKCESMSAIEGERIRRKLRQKLNSEKSKNGGVSKKQGRTNQGGQRGIKTRHQSVSAVEGELMKMKLKERLQRAQIAEESVKSLTTVSAKPDGPTSAGIGTTDGRRRQSDGLTRRITTVSTKVTPDGPISAGFDTTDGTRRQPDGPTREERRAARRKRRAKARRRASTSEILDKPRRRKVPVDTTPETRREAPGIRRWQSVHDIVPEYRKPIKRSGSVPSLESTELIPKTSDTDTSEGRTSPVLSSVYRPEIAVTTPTNLLIRNAQDRAEEKLKIGIENAGFEQTPEERSEKITGGIVKRPGVAVREATGEAASSPKTEYLTALNNVSVRLSPVLQRVWDKQNHVARPGGDAVSITSDDTEQKEVTTGGAGSSMVGDVSAGGIRNAHQTTSEIGKPTTVSEVVTSPPPPPPPPPPVLPPAESVPAPAQRPPEDVASPAAENTTPPTTAPPPSAPPPPPPAPPPPPLWHARRHSESGLRHHSVVNATPTEQQHQSETKSEPASRRVSRSSPGTPSAAVERKQSMTRSRVEQKIWTTQNINKNQPVTFASGMGYRDCMPELQARLQQRLGANNA